MTATPAIRAYRAGPWVGCLWLLPGDHSGTLYRTAGQVSAIALTRPGGREMGTPVMQAMAGHVTHLTPKSG